MKKTKEPTIALQRAILGSVNLSHISKKDESEQDRRDYCAAIFSVFPRLEKTLKEMMQEQLLFSSNEADTWERVIFGRGTFNGMALLLENFERASKEHEANSKPEEAFDRHNPVPSV